jgi:hypothetical protein
MTDAPTRPDKAYRNQAFLASRDGRPIRILAEYVEPEARFEDFKIADTIVFFGSSRLKSRQDAESALAAAREGDGDVAAGERDLAMSRYYEEARDLAGRLTEWSKGLEGTSRRFVICSGGGPGIMEAANRGASEERGINVGLNISIPHEQHENPYITRQLAFEFHYFFMRKFWFAYLAKAIVIFPGGFGTLDEFFEILTLVQTRKLKKPMTIVLYGAPFWNDVLDLDALVRHGTIDAVDLDLFRRTDSVDEAFDAITADLTERALDAPGRIL